MESPFHIAEATGGRWHIHARQVAIKAIDVGGVKSLLLLQEAPIHRCLLHHGGSNILAAITNHGGDAEGLAAISHIIQRITEQIAVDTGPPREAHHGCFLLHQVAGKNLLELIRGGGTHLLQRSTACLIPHTLAHSLSGL